LGHVAAFSDTAAVDPDREAAQPLELGRRMADEQQCAGLAEIVDPIDAFLLESGVAHRQGFIDDQDLGIHMSADGEGQPGAHASRVELDWLVHEVADAGEVGDGVELGDDLVAFEAEHRPADQHVLASGRFEIEGGAQRQHGRHAAFDPDLALGRPRHAAHDLQKS